jgi:hypothetical protein
MLMLKTSMATLAAGLAAAGGQLALISLIVVVVALAVSGGPDWGHRVLRLLRDCRDYRRESKALRGRGRRTRRGSK